MHPNAELLTGFYRAFAARDGAAMASAYASEARFSDPVFTDLRGTEVGAMWQMLCSRATDLRVEASGISADDLNGRAHWEAWYTFTKTGRKVHNVIDATFEFRDGKIIAHRDVFDLWRWAGMALGPSGKLLGWTPMVQNAVRKEAKAGLAKYMAKGAG
jgi:limonene-1,2-epoxide hydrolase